MLLYRAHHKKVRKFDQVFGKIEDSFLKEITFNLLEGSLT